VYYFSPSTPYMFRPFLVSIILTFISNLFNLYIFKLSMYALFYCVRHCVFVASPWQCRWRVLNMEEVRLQTIRVAPQWSVFVVLINKIATKFWVALSGGSFLTDSATDKSSSNLLRRVFLFYFTNALRWSGSHILPAMTGQCGKKLTVSIVIPFFEWPQSLDELDHIFVKTNCRAALGSGIFLCVCVFLEPSLGTVCCCEECSMFSRSERKHNLVTPTQ